MQGKNIFRLATVFLIALAVMITPFPSAAQLSAPQVSATTLLGWRVTGGTLNNGGHAVTVAASTGNATASQSTCAAPAYSSCYFIYANSSGTVAGSVTLATASATGNTILAMVESSGTAITKLTTPNNSGATGTIGPFAQITSCVNSLTCASPVSTAAQNKVAYGTASLSSGTPSTAAVSGIAPAFTSTSTMYCTASPIGTTAAIAAGGLAINLVSSSAFTVTGPNTVTTSFFWECRGN